MLMTPRGDLGENNNLGFTKRVVPRFQRHWLAARTSGSRGRTMAATDVDLELFLVARQPISHKEADLLTLFNQSTVLPSLFLSSEFRNTRTTIDDPCTFPLGLAVIHQRSSLGLSQGQGEMMGLTARSSAPPTSRASSKSKTHPKRLFEPHALRREHRTRSSTSETAANSLNRLP